LICAGTDIPLCQQEDGTYLGAAQIARAHSWMPHTHGRPHRYCVTLVLQGQTFDLGEVGFRRIDIDTDQGGFRFVVNGLPIFCRGVCWTPPDLVGLSAAPEVYARQIGQLVAAGANMIRVGGTMVYEVDAFFEACDAAGVMVWHDFMLANFDYPSRDAHFMQSLEAEASHFLSRTRHHPCLALICGGSEVRQQAEMMGVEWPQVEPLYEGLLAEVCKFERPDVPFLPNSPWGGQPAFSTSQGVSHYYGVGAYMRPLEDARRASVRFTSECMALAHVPGQAELPATLAQQVGGWRWKQGVPRDAGAAWDFDDVRDHYVQRLYGVDPAALRYADSARYLDLGRAVSCDLAEALFSEWRRAGSTCAGALVWQWRDLFPGAGWGLLDQAGVAKPVLKALSRLWQPVHLGLTDEGLNGLSVHLVNETEQIMQGEITLEALRDGHHVIISGQKDVTLPARSQLSLTSGQIWGRFFDATCAYRFGPPGHEVTVASLRNADGQTLMAWACHLPERHLHRADLGLRYRIESSTSGLNLWVSTERFAQYLNFSSEGYFVDDDWVHLPPGVEHRIRLTPKPGVLQDAALAGGTLSALNSAQAIWVRLGSA
jgi:beta-mannosidase